MIEAQELVDRVLGLSRADETIVLVSDESQASLRWAGNSMTTNGMSSSRRWTAVSIVRGDGDARVGTVSSTSVDPADIESVVAASEAAARSAAPANDAMPLIDGGDVDTDWDLPPRRTDVDVFTTVAADLARGFDSADRLYGFADHHISSTWLATSTGVRRRSDLPTGSVTINGKRGTDASAWVGAGTSDFADIDIPRMLADLGTRLDWSATRFDLPAGRYETLLPPSAVADFMIYLAWFMEGRGAQEGHTAFSKPGGTLVGERLTDLPLTLYSDPGEPGLEFAPFTATPASSQAYSVFDNGMPIERADWLREGVVNSLYYPRAAAAEFGTAPALFGDNLVLTGGTDATLDDMIARTERGLLLTTLWYIRTVDPTNLLLTGLTRDGVYLVENGEVRGAVNNFRFNESPLDLLRRATEAGATAQTLPREIDDFTRAAMPALRIPDFNMSSVSQAQ